MIKQEEVNISGRTFLHTYSDNGFYIEQVETKNIYDEAFDVLPCKYTYRETEHIIEPIKVVEPERTEQL